MNSFVTDNFSDPNNPNSFPSPGHFRDPTSLPDLIPSDIGASIPSLKNLSSSLYTESVPIPSLGLSNIDELQQLGILLSDTPDLTNFAADNGSEPEGAQYLLSGYCSSPLNSLLIDGFSDSRIQARCPPPSRLLPTRDLPELSSIDASACLDIEECEESYREESWYVVLNVNEAPRLTRSLTSEETANSTYPPNDLTVVQDPPVDMTIEVYFIFYPIKSGLGITMQAYSSLAMIMIN